ncbi:MAG: hypothetical protein GQ477_04985, partial [Nanohaloarchaea archaeon]|nr:hypothetical protein [Candidatus Nanohaloarchaea archaeon]
MNRSNKKNRERTVHPAVSVIALTISFLFIYTATQGLAIVSSGEIPQYDIETLQDIQTIDIINTHSTPEVGGIWTIYFNTTGDGPLHISNLNPDEVAFNSLYYKDTTITDPNDWIKLLSGITTYDITTDWDYRSGKLINDVLSEGKHAIVFDFGFANTVYAYNNAFTNQKTFDLDLDNPNFGYEQNQLNTSEYSALFAFDQNNHTEFAINIPKDANVTSSTIDFTGQIYPIIYDVGVDIWDVKVGDISTVHSGNEIIIGSYDPSNNLKVISSANIDIWEVSGTSDNYNRYDVAIGNFTEDIGSEIVTAEQDSDLTIYNSTGSQIWNFTVPGEGKSVAIDNITSDSGNEILFGTSTTDHKIYLINSSKDVIWNFPVDSDVNTISVDDLDLDTYNEIVIGTAGGQIYVLNRTGQEINNWTGNGNVGEVSIGNASNDNGLEIAVATDNATVYLLNSTLDEIWSYEILTDNKILSVGIGEFSDTNDGDEIFFGSDDNYIYILNSTGDLILKYLSDSDVRAITQGIVTSSNGTNIYDIIGGTIGSELHILNYDSFPTDLILDINSDDNYDWNFSTGDGRLRSTATLDDANANISNNLNSYLDGVCATPLCDVPSTIYASNDVARGYLNVSAINISYDYNASSVVSYAIIDHWSRTDSISTDETIVSEGKNITFDNSAIDMIIRYIAINDTATSCGLDETYINVTINIANYCNITSKNFIVSADTTISKVLWDNSMRLEMPITINESGTSKTYYTDNFDVIKNVTVGNDNTYGASLFTDITSNATIDDTDPEVHGDIRLSVIWDSNVFDITPATVCPTMDSSLALGFSACNNDTNGNGIYDFIEWIQPNLTAGTSVQYIVKAALNLHANITDANVTSNSGIWGNPFNYSVHINDSDGDRVNVTLWVTVNDTWADKGTITVDGYGLAEFNNILSTKEWALATNSYKFEYFDFNSTGYQIHSKINTTDHSGPTIIKHNVTVSNVFGNDSIVYRENDSTQISVIFNDTTLSVPVNEPDISCTFYIAHNGQNLTFLSTTTVNSTGHCNHDLNPDSNYSVGAQMWNVSIDPRYYNMQDMLNYTVDVKGNASINIVNPGHNESILRNTTISFSAQLTDEYDIDVTDSSIKTTNYTCTWHFNNTEIGSSPVGPDGSCIYNWIPSCSYVNLEDYMINVTINSTVPANYSLDYDESYDVRLTDNIILAIDTPYYHQQFYKGNELNLNSTVTDGCGTQDLNTYTVSWYAVNKKVILNITELSGTNITEVPAIIKASALEANDINVSLWKINSTRLEFISNGTESTVPMQIQNVSIGQTYMDTDSEIVFLINMSANESLTYVLSLDEQNPNIYSDYTLSFIRNNDFSDNGTEYWTGDGTALSVGNTSVLQISAFENIKNVSQTLFEPIETEYVKIRYRQNNVYQNIEANVTLIIDDYVCDLENFTDAFDTTWKTMLCNDPQINGSTNMTLSVVDTGNGESTDIQIDHICISDINGTCINSMAGSDISVGYDTKTFLGNGNTTWSTSLNHTVGAQKIVAYGSGPYYATEKTDVTVDIFGTSQVSNVSVSSASCSEDGLRCFLNSTVEITCNVSDANTSTGIFNHTVSFYDNLTFLGNSNTDYDGIATYTWINSTSLKASHPIICNISDAPDIYYNVSQNVSDTVNVSFSDDKTSGNILFDTSYFLAENITFGWNDTVNIGVLINNTGNFDMFNPEIASFYNTGFSIGSDKCDSILPFGNCTTNIIINVTQYAALGNNTLDFTLTWDNNNTDFVNESIIVDVLNTTYLKITDAQIDSSEISYSVTKTLGNFTISAFGNTPLPNVSINTTGGNSSIVNDWLNYSKNNFDIGATENDTITVNITVPENISLVGSYWTYIIVNDTGSLCLGAYDSCSDKMLLNITVKDLDWKVTVTDYEVTAGKGGPTEIGSFKPVTIVNGLDQNLSLIINISGNGSSYVTADITLNDTILSIVSGDNYTILPYLNGILDIDYNVSDANIGQYEINVTITSIDNDLVPLSVTELLSLSVSALSIDITYPTESQQAGPVNSSDNITIYVDAEYNYVTITDPDDINWSVNISGVPCLHGGETVFNFAYVGTTYDYELQCNVPL